MPNVKFFLRFAPKNIRYTSPLCKYLNPSLVSSYDMSIGWGFSQDWIKLAVCNINSYHVVSRMLTLPGVHIGAQYTCVKKGASRPFRRRIWVVPIAFRQSKLGVLFDLEFRYSGNGLFCGCCMVRFKYGAFLSQQNTGEEGEEALLVQTSRFFVLGTRIPAHTTQNTLAPYAFARINQARGVINRRFLRLRRN